MGRLTPLGMVLGGPIGAMIGTALSNGEQQRLGSRENEEYERIQRDLDTILSQPRQELQYEVDTSNTLMPKDDRNFLIRYLSPRYEFPYGSEDRLAYFGRMFRQSNIVSERTERVFLNQGHIWLEFDVVRSERIAEKKRLTLFEPHYTDKGKIEGDVTFMIDKHFLRYVAYSMQKPSIKDQTAQKPSKVEVK